MELHQRYSQKHQALRSPNLKLLGWFEKRVVVGKYSYSLKNIFYVALIALIVFAAVSYLVAIYRIKQTDSNAAIEREISTLTLKIGKVMELPKGEKPTLATVSDRQKLKGQSFFANANNGDKLLIYQKAKKAVLYRPSTGKIIDVTNLTSGNRIDPPAEEPAADFPNQ